MSRYYCPYCSPNYQSHQKRIDGVLICSQCGDPLERKPLVKPTQIFALIAVFAFIAPLIMMMTTFFRDQNKPSSQQFIHLIVVISTKP